MKLKLAARKVESPGVVSFIFKPGEPLVWKAGQFLHYVLNHESTDDRGSDRWFTIASAPCERHVMLTTRFAGKQGSTFKKTLKALKRGDIIEVSDLDGDFILSDARKEFEKAAEEERLSLAAEFWIFLRENKKWWLLPILLVFGAIAVFAALLSTGFAPFVYPAM